MTGKTVTTYTDAEFLREMKIEHPICLEQTDFNNRLEQIAKRLDVLDKKTMEESGGYIP